MTPPTRFAPILDPRDPASAPLDLRSGETVLCALLPHGVSSNRRRRVREWADRARLVGHFCYSDATLQRLERDDPLGLRLARDAGIQECVTMDVPFYGFMTPAQRERAWHQHVHRLHASLERFPRAGIDPIPLVKGLSRAQWEPQFNLLTRAGVNRVAFYARELLLEGRHDQVERFVRRALRSGLRPLLLGAFTRRALTWGPATLASMRPYVLARRQRILLPHGSARALTDTEYSPLTRRWIFPGHVAGLATHNWRRAQLLLTPPPSLDAFGEAG